MSLEVVSLVLAVLVAINLVLASALVSTIRQERAHKARQTGHGPVTGPGRRSV